MWGEVGRGGERWGEMGRDGERWGDVGERGGGMGRAVPAATRPRRASAAPSAGRLPESSEKAPGRLLEGPQPPVVSCEASWKAPRDCARLVLRRRDDVLVLRRHPLNVLLHLLIDDSFFTINQVLAIRSMYSCT